ncbi:uncharacterized protein LOC128754785 isoform X2 [Synchiropus splendidus]|uniref:uncharacterized protein LOC128754785 isoform X2 n=1 Tax=Synchiropus splendidus TaxID=270530 RepID=UPI00237ED3A9|nr:uncharacterized protein LOC128754785 isoform X2 [Synchiropus splendidus]
MKTWYLFLLVYLLGSCCEASKHHKNEACKPEEDFKPGSTQAFLQCVGLPSTDTKKEHVRALKDLLEATMDLYTFMRTSLKGVPVLSMKGALEWTPDREFENEDLVKMWLEIKIQPMLKSISKQFLACLSTKNFSCSTYQTVVKQLSHHFLEMDETRQRWIYMFFMIPFLSGHNVKGCVMQNESSEEWLLKNFGYFKAMARFSDFTKINLAFRGLEVLHLLTSSQTAEMLLVSDLKELNDDMQAGILRSLSLREAGPGPRGPRGGGHRRPGPEHNSTSMSKSVYKPPSPEDHVRWVFNDFLSAMRPVGNVVHKFVSLTHKKKESEMTGAVLTQFALDCALAEMANRYKPQVQEKPEFDVLDLEDWYEQVVMPLLRRFLPHHVLPLHENVRLAFEEVFYLDRHMDEQDPEIEDVCSITLNKRPCVLTDTVKNVAQVLHCAARANLELDEQTVMWLINEMLKRLNSVLEELTTSNVLMEEIQEIFTEEDSQSMTEEHLNDPEFIRLWFKVKMMPLLPNISADLLLCLSTKNFTCLTYQTIVGAFSQQSIGSIYGHRIYEHFIFPFLHDYYNTSKCLSNDSAQWLKLNLGFFLEFAKLTELIMLNPHFKPLEVLPLLTPEHLVDLLLLDLQSPAERRINKVFDFLLREPEKFPAVLRLLPKKAEEVGPPCSVYRMIFKRLNEAMAVRPLEDQFIGETIEKLLNSAPEECVTNDIACPITKINGALTCREVDSSHLERHLNTSMGIPCNFTLKEYACAQLQTFSADHLASLMMCELPGPGSKSKTLWKMVLTKVFSVWDPALDKLDQMLPPGRGPPAATELLDLFREMKLAGLTEDQLNSTSVIGGLFSGGIRRLLPFASGGFLDCLSRQNLSCGTFQHIVWVLSDVKSEDPEMVAKKFIIHFLSRPEAGWGCSNGLNSTEWFMKNLGSFSEFVPVDKMLQLNPYFKPLVVIVHLSPRQLASLFLLKHSNIPDKEVLIVAAFHMFSQSSDEAGFDQFLSELVLIVAQANMTCTNYGTLFSGLDRAIERASPPFTDKVQRHKISISLHLPAGCVIYSGTCRVTPANETEICADVNSSVVQQHLDSWNLTGHQCLFSVKEVACAELSMLEAADLAEIMKCHRSTNSSGSRAAWKLLLSKANGVLDMSLEHVGTEMLDPHNQATSVVLDVIQELRIDFFSLAFLNEHEFSQKWLHGKLRPFLPATSPDFLSCMAVTDFNCTTYQDIVATMSVLHVHMLHSTQVAVYSHFIRVFLTKNDSADPGCDFNSNNTGDWIQLNLRFFLIFASFSDLQMFRGNFSGLEVLEHLTTAQLGQMCATPNQIKSAAEVAMVMGAVQDHEMKFFFLSFYSALMKHGVDVPSATRPSWLEAMLERANLAHDSVSDAEVADWIPVMGPFIVGLSHAHANLIFKILRGRGCNVEKLGVETLESKASTMSETTKSEINRLTSQMVAGNSLRCMEPGQSLYVFLESYFGSFGFPSLTQVMSFMSQGERHQKINSMSPSQLGKFLRRPRVVDSHKELCVLFKIYTLTPWFIEKEPLAEDLYEPTMECVWPLALGSGNGREAEAWKKGLDWRYMRYIRRSMVGPNITHSASCFGFQIFVACLGSSNFTETDFQPEHVYESIKDYLPSSSVPRCYNSSHSELNSTAWFVLYIGKFINLVTEDDFLSFGSEEHLAAFTVNSECLALLNASNVTTEVNEVYTELIYMQDSAFPVDKLPYSSTCHAPGAAFTTLSKGSTEWILGILRQFCVDVDTQIAAALAGNFGSDITAGIISMLGNQCTGLSTGVLRGCRSEEIYGGRHRLGAVPGWNIGQARAAMEKLMASVSFQMNGLSMVDLGTLLIGVTGEMFYNVQGTDIVTASAHSSFVTQLNAAPRMARFIATYKMVSLYSNIEQMMVNIPDDLAQEIPQSFLFNFPADVEGKKNMNKKKWSRDQAVFVLPELGSEASVSAIGNVNTLSSAVLQGFTCTSVRTFKTSQTVKLIKACRRKKANKVKLEETQLTCMYNYIKGDSNVTSYGDYPEDMLLYYDYSLVPRAQCREYFMAISEADFYVFSPQLAYMRSNLMLNAVDCLGVTGSNLTKENVQVFGNMACQISSSYIQNSDPYILEMLKKCNDLTSVQAEAVEALLLSGRTSYGDPSQWKFRTLKSLQNLPMYMSSKFYDSVRKRPRRRFLKYYFKLLRKTVSKEKLQALKKSTRRARSKRAVDSDCRVGEITYVTIKGEDFPGEELDVQQFNACLSSDTVSKSLAEIAAKVVEVEYQQVVLEKLHQAYPAMVPEEEVEVLGFVSRAATVSHVDKWIITKVDTLAALLDPSDGLVAKDMAQAIIIRYLAAGNLLGTDELRAIGGANLCSLNGSVLQNISHDALREADLKDLTTCSLDGKKILFAIAFVSFSTNTRSTVSSSTYNLIRPFLGGATTEYVRTLAQSNLNVDVPTFAGLDPDVLRNLSVSDVVGLLGNHLSDLSLYQNETGVMVWIENQFQDELDKLNLGLAGGKATPTTTQPTPTKKNTAATTKKVTGTNKPATTKATTPAAAATATTASSHGNHIKADASLFFTLLLLLTLTRASS